MPETTQRYTVRQKIDEAEFRAHVTLAEIVPLLKSIPKSRLPKIQEFLDRALEEARKNSPSTTIRAVDPLVRGANP